MVCIFSIQQAYLTSFKPEVPTLISKSYEIHTVDSSPEYIKFEKKPVSFFNFELWVISSILISFYLVCMTLSTTKCTLMHKEHHI